MEESGRLFSNNRRASQLSVLLIWCCVHRIYKLAFTLQTISFDLVIQAEIANLLKGVEAHACLHH